MAPLRRGSILTLVCLAFGCKLGFVALRQSVLRRAVVETDQEVRDPLKKLSAMLPLVTGRSNQSLEFVVRSTSPGTSVQLKLPSLQYRQYVPGKGTQRFERSLPSFQATGDTLLAAKEAAAEAALSSLFRTLNTRPKSGNNKAFAQVMASAFKDSVEVAQVRLKADLENTTRSPGNLLYSLAYLAREQYPDSEKRILTVAQATLMPSERWQVMVQQGQSLVMSSKVETLKVAAGTSPENLAATMRKALRSMGGVKLQAAGTKAAEQLFLALVHLTHLFPHRFRCFFRGDFKNATGLEVHVAKRWRPLT